MVQGAFLSQLLSPSAASRGQTLKRALESLRSSHSDHYRGDRFGQRGDYSEGVIYMSRCLLSGDAAHGPSDAALQQ